MSFILYIKKKKKHLEGEPWLPQVPRAASGPGKVQNPQGCAESHLCDLILGHAESPLRLKGSSLSLYSRVTKKILKKSSTNFQCVLDTMPGVGQ